MLLAVDEEHAWKQLNLVTEQLERNRARQESGIRENTFSERHLIGDWPWLTEDQSNRSIRLGRGLSGKEDLDVSNAEPGLVNQYPWSIRGAVVNVTRHGPFRVRRCSMLW